MKKIKYIIGMIITCGTVVSCSDFLDTDIPKDQINRSTVFNDDRTAVSAMNQCYTLLRNTGFLSGSLSGMGVWLGCHTDELEAVTSRAIDYRYFYEGSITPSTPGIKSLWNDTYKQIYTVNAVLEGLENAQGLTPAVASQLKGEATAIRGLLHFYLSQTFGAVPYVVSTDYNINKNIQKKSSEAVLLQSITDLEKAEKLLVVEYPSSEKVRINLFVVKALLARMYLYTNNWILAQQYAQEVINSGMYEPELLEKVFLKESTSALWQLKPEIEGGNSSEAYAYIFTSVPAPQIKLSSFFNNCFEPGDLRKEQWVRAVGTGMENTHPYKYRERGTSPPSKEYSIIIRVEEMYLIAAETAMEMGNWQLCNDMLNVLRAKAGLEGLDLQNKETALKAILQERRVELFCEFGHRFYDLKRRNKLEQIALAKDNWKPHFSLLPLPETELLLNPGMLPQNTGY